MSNTKTKQNSIITLTSPNKFGDEKFEFDPKDLVNLNTKSAKMRYLATLWEHSYDYDAQTGRNVAGVVVKALNTIAESGKDKVVYQQVRQCLETMMMRK